MVGLKDKLGLQLMSSLDFSSCDADILFLGVTDDALAEVSKEIKLAKKTAVVHFSGATSLSVLSKFEKQGHNTGVMYPLQSFATPLDSIRLARTPFFIQTTALALKEKMQAMLSSVGAKFYPINEPERQKLHVAAVLAHNFSNRLLSHAKEILDEAHLSFECLSPLVQDGIAQAFVKDPLATQSGPAWRGDEKVLLTHEQQLKNKPRLQHIYRLLSQDILQAGLQKRARDGQD